MEKVILFGPFVGEMYWEAARFAPILPYFKIKRYPEGKMKYIVLTREDRFDLYGKFADILVPLKIEGDYKKMFPNCYRLDKYSNVEYMNVVDKFNKKYSERYKIKQHFYPDIKGKRFLNRRQFSTTQMLFKYSPRDDNYKLIKEYILNKTDKKIVVLAPRFRGENFNPSSIRRRNWPYWNEFYDMIYNNEFLMNKYFFVICGKNGEHVPDKKNRFVDMNMIPLTENSSLIGLLLVILENAYFTCGSQSAIPNLSLLYGVEALEFGHQKALHTRSYNLKGTPVTFLESSRYDLKPKILFENLHKILKKKYKKETK